MMKSCAVPSCPNDSLRHPELSFYSFPRDANARGEWLEQIGLKRSDCNNNLKICEVHFKPKDFCAGKRQLKTHALPVLKLGVGKTEPVNSDDEFMQCNSDSDPEIVEVKKISAAAVVDPATKNKEKPVEKVTIKQEPVDWESEPTGRPSRRAARLAAKKIYNTVHNYGLGEVDDSDISEVVVPPKPVSTPRSYPRQRAKPVQNMKFASANIDLLMECHEELLSAAQAEALLKAQLEYNMVMKTLRSLKANNVRIICTPLDEFVPETADQNSNQLKSSGSDTLRKSPNIVTLAALKSENVGIVPMELSSASQSPSPVFT